MPAATTTPGLPPLPAPPKVRPGKPIPPRIDDMLAIVHVLIGYGLHLAETLEHRAVARGFATIAQFFGTARLQTIQTRLARGLLRAMALERVLLARAARGRDLVFFKPRDPAPHQARPQAQRALAEPPPPRRATVRGPNLAEHPDPDALPTLDQLEAQIRRRPVGRAITEICSDLGISPSLCDGNLWFALTCAMMRYRGNLPRLMKEFRRREVVFCDTEADRNPALGWPAPTRDGIRGILGFFIGEPPATPFPLPAPAQPPVAVPRPP